MASLIDQLRRLLQFEALLTTALEARITGKEDMAALFTNEPAWFLLHRNSLLTINAIRAAKNLFGHPKSFTSGTSSLEDFRAFSHRLDAERDYPALIDQMRGARLGSSRVKWRCYANNDIETRQWSATFPSRPRPGEAAGVLFCCGQFTSLRVV